MPAQDKPCDGLCCPDADRCSGRELIAAEIRAMQYAIAPGLLTEIEALAALQAAAPFLTRGTLFRAALAAAPVLYAGLVGYSHGARLLCLRETVAMLGAVLAVRRQFLVTEIARATAPVPER